jgi:hypothetical protein
LGLISKRLTEEATLVGVAGQPEFVQPTLMGLLHSTRVIPFENVKFFVPDSCDFFLEGFDIVRIPPMDYLEYAIFMLGHLADHIDTPYCITTQDDGFIINPRAWRDDFLNYDYIGALWPSESHAANIAKSRNGNGGFSLRSKKFLDCCQSTWNEKHSKILFIDDNDHITIKTKRWEYIHASNERMFEDQWACADNRKSLEDSGIQFAPNEICEKFSVEFDPYTLKTFGHHHSKHMHKQEDLSDVYRYMPVNTFYDYMTQNHFAYSDMRKKTLGKTPDLWQSYKKYSLSEGYGDMGTAHCYIDFYNHIFKKHETDNVSLLEIGSGRGYSMMTWADYFTNSDIIGVDVVDVCDFNDPPFVNHICDAVDKHQLDECLGDMMFDYIIDDASHVPEEQFITFKYLFDRIKPNGYYIIQSVRIDELKEIMDLAAQDCTFLDFRYFQGRWDDVICMIKKNQEKELD